MLCPLATPQALSEEPDMVKKNRHNKAKSIVAQPLFRSRQEKPGKGKGSYRRQASQQNWEAFCLLAA
jgi:alternative ribosome-rescue factor